MAKVEKGRATHRLSRNPSAETDFEFASYMQDNLRRANAKTKASSVSKNIKKFVSERKKEASRAQKVLRRERQPSGHLEEEEEEEEEPRRAWSQAEERKERARAQAAWSFRQEEEGEEKGRLWSETAEEAERRRRGFKRGQRTGKE